MICQWCAGREAEWWIQPNVGPQSRACTPCRDRVCRREVREGKVVFLAEKYDFQEKKAEAHK